VSANPCPDGTGTRILLLTGAILVYVVALLFSGQGMFFYGLLFVALSAVFIRGAVTDDGFAATGWIVGVLFAGMGIVPMYLAVRGWFSRDEDEARGRAAGLAAYAQVALGREGEDPQRLTARS
jgi:sugar phosphate permease